MNNKGFTLVEILVVVVIIGILIAATMPRFEQTRINSQIDTVEADLRTFTLDFNNYNLDFGGPYINNCNDDTIIDSVDYAEETRNIIRSINSYLGHKLNETTLSTHRTSTSCRIETQTELKKDPWGNYYKVLIDVKNGNVIVTSSGPDKVFAIDTYKDNDFGDDILVIIRNN